MADGSPEPARAGREGSSLVDAEDVRGVRILALARPPGNALAADLLHALESALAAAEEDAACRAVVLTGAPGVFSTGADPAELPEVDAPASRAFGQAMNVVMARLYGLGKPTVAAVTGPALGAGLVLALACDLRMAVEGTYELGLTEAAAGHAFTEGALVVMRHELDPRTARRLALGSLTFGPRDRLARAFVDEVTELEFLRDRAVARARRLAAQPAFAAVKRQLRAPGLAELERMLPRAHPTRARGPGGG